MRDSVVMMQEDEQVSRILIHTFSRDAKLYDTTTQHRRYVTSPQAFAITSDSYELSVDLHH